MNIHNNRTWKVMIVDDQPEIHEITQFALEGFIFQGKTISFFSAYSAKEAKLLLQAHPDIALIFLDIMIEEPDSGLKLVKCIRDTLQNKMIRIILHTSQPEDDLDESIIIDYDINDYTLKVEMTPRKLFITTVAGLRSYNELTKIEANKTALKKLNSAYERFVPHEFLKLLGKQNVADVHLADQIEKDMTVLFSDIRGFTTLSENMSPQETFNFLNSYLSQMEPIVFQYNGFIDKYVGDEIMALFPKAEDAVSAAVAMLKKLIDYNEGRQRAGYKTISIGIGINSGKLILGTIGSKNRMDGTVISDAVNLASRVENLTKKYGVSLLISENTYKLIDPLQYAIRIIDRVKVKGKKQATTVYEVFDGDLSQILELKTKTLSMMEKGWVYYCRKEFTQALQYFKQILDIYPNDKTALIYINRCENFQQYGKA